MNCVFADAAGNVGYTILGAFPLLPPGPANSGDLPLDGTRSANNWRKTIPYELIPQVVNPSEGYVVTANDRPIQTFYPLRLGLGAGGETLRGLRIKEKIREHLDQGKKFGLEDNLPVQNDSVNPMIKLVLRLGYHLRDDRQVELPAEALRSLAYLEEMTDFLRWIPSGTSSRRSCRSWPERCRSRVNRSRKSWTSATRIVRSRCCRSATPSGPTAGSGSLRGPRGSAANCAPRPCRARQRRSCPSLGWC